ncbi:MULTISPECIES: hypothetical protein [unclassified Streptomyces]|uniref:hypothetical protein n=1 Tax=unclassified Streptomyces TaxID=2593676 RepID=UPI00035F80AE|nr:MULTISPECIES: hypothetical protein [unclassified Streptomyces]MYT27534.1 hypothetical protein [Streptomyces sp. SID8354]
MTSAYTLATAPGTFSHAHIALTACVTGVLALAAAAWRLPRRAWIDIAAVTVLSAASVYLWRASANMPQLNDDGLPGFSANDWAAPVLTYVFLGAYAQLRTPADPRRYAQARALAVIASLAVNVITI